MRQASQTPASQEAGVLFPELVETNFVSDGSKVEFSNSVESARHFGGDGGESASSSSDGHNSDRTLPIEENGQRPLPFKLSGSQAKTAYALRSNVTRMIEEDGLDCVGFMTLTVGEFEPLAGSDPSNDIKGRGSISSGFKQVWDGAEASRRINNLNRHVLPAIFERAIIVTERHASGAIHFHLVGTLLGRPDIRTGFDFSAVGRGDYSSACPALRRIWALLREALPKYGFGRAELTPIRKQAEDIAKYVSKYIAKNLFARLEGDRRKKLVRYLGWNKSQMKPNEFSWCGARAAAWRRNAAALAGLAGVRNRSEVAEAFGPRWAYRLSRVMNAVAGNALQPCEEITRCIRVRELARQFVFREARMRWVHRRSKANGRLPGHGWRWRPLRDRLQKTFAMNANNERNQ